MSAPGVRVRRCVGCVLPGDGAHRCRGVFATIQGGQDGSNDGLNTVACECLCAEDAFADVAVLRPVPGA